MSKITITLTNRPPVRVYSGNWPIISEALAENWDGQYEFQATWKQTDWIRVRQHQDGRALVYGGHDYVTSWQGSPNVSRREGFLEDPGADLVAAIRALGALLGSPDEVIRQVIGGLPAEDLDPPEQYIDAFNKHWSVTPDRISWVWDRQPSVGYGGLQLSGSAEKGTALYAEWLAELTAELAKK